MKHFADLHRFGRDAFRSKVRGLSSPCIATLIILRL
jgi:hypothetical protein